MTYEHEDAEQDGVCLVPLTPVLTESEALLQGYINGLQSRERSLAHDVSDTGGILSRDDIEALESQSEDLAMCQELLEKARAALEALRN